MLSLLLFHQSRGHASSSSSSSSEEEEEEATEETTDSVDDGSVPDDVLVEKTDPKDLVLLTEGDKKKRPKIEPIPYKPRGSSPFCEDNETRCLRRMPPLGRSHEETEMSRLGTDRQSSVQP